MHDIKTVILDDSMSMSNVICFLNNDDFTANFEIFVGVGICVNCEFSEKTLLFQICTEYRKMVQIQWKNI